VVRLVQVKDAIREVNEIVQSANVENLLASAHLERIHPCLNRCTLTNGRIGRPHCSECHRAALVLALSRPQQRSTHSLTHSLSSLTNGSKAHRQQSPS
jgi:hypothetical protein